MQPAEARPWAHPWPDPGPPPLLALPLTDPLRARLRAVREQQMEDYRAGRPEFVLGIFLAEEVVCLRSGGGHAAFLGTDGRVHYANYGEGKEVVTFADPRDIAKAIVMCAGDIGVPELVGQLPPRPGGGVRCRLCGGARWESPDCPNALSDRPWCCRRCHGLGWTLA